MGECTSVKSRREKEHGIKGGKGDTTQKRIPKKMEENTGQNSGHKACKRRPWRQETTKERVIRKRGKEKQQQINPSPS